MAQPGVQTLVLEMCQSSLGLEYFPTECILHGRGSIYPLGRAQEPAICRTAQEAIRNSERHAHANKISATLAYTPTAVQFEVQDDGIGFRVPQHFQEFAVENHHGLIGVRERILHSGGQLNVMSQDHAGTRIAVTFPQLIHA